MKTLRSFVCGILVNADFTNATFFDTFCVEPSVSMNYGDTAMYQGISLLPNADMIVRLVGGYLASGPTIADAAAVH